MVYTFKILKQILLVYLITFSFCTLTQSAREKSQIEACENLIRPSFERCSEKVIDSSSESTQCCYFDAYSSGWGDRDWCQAVSKTKFDALSNEEKKILQCKKSFRDTCTKINPMSATDCTQISLDQKGEELCCNYKKGLVNACIEMKKKDFDSLDDVNKKYVTCYSAENDCLKAKPSKSTHCTNIKLNSDKKCCYFKTPFGDEGCTLINKNDYDKADSNMKDDLIC